MKIVYILIGLLFVLVTVIFVAFKFLGKQQSSTVNQPKNVNETINKTNNMKIASSVFANNQTIPAKYTCDGDPPAGGVNPPLSISDVPSAAKSLALIVDDPDAPAGTWVHWLVWNIDPKINEIGENSIPSNAVQGTTSFGKPSYGGPCPPSGTHRYFFKLYALDNTLLLDDSAKKEDLEKAMERHILDKAELIGLYSRK